jgi:DNA-binding MarR family transcriptional regulator
MFTDCYCTQFRRASNALTQIYDAALKPAGLRITQFSLLRSLARLGQATSTQVGVELSLDRTTISRNVKLLIDAGWVGVVEADDKRERVLAITKAGQKKIADALPYFKKAQKTVEQGAETFVETSKDNRLLEALENLQRAGAESAAVR